MGTGFFWDEQCFWHGGGNYASMLPVGGLVQPMSGGLPDNPETRRRLKNLIDVTGLADDLICSGASPVTEQEMARVHTKKYLQDFRAASDSGGGELGMRAPFGPGGFEIAACSAGLVQGALQAVLNGSLTNAYALARPPGHHCLPDQPNGFCLLANAGIAVRTVQASHPGIRVAVLDWDVHHGNGTEAVFYGDAEVLTVSIHQDRNYPMDTGFAADRGRGSGVGFNMNIPLSPGAGHATYVSAMESLVLPAIETFNPDIIIVVCGYDAAANDPLGRMLATAQTFATMTDMTMQLADKVCGGKLVMTHEGGYSEIYVPFCGHAVLQTLSGSKTEAPDPFAETFSKRQPGPDFQKFLDAEIAQLQQFFFG